MSGIGTNRIWDKHTERFITRQDYAVLMKEFVDALGTDATVTVGDMGRFFERFAPVHPDVVLIHVVTPDTHFAFLYLNDEIIGSADYLDAEAQGRLADLAYRMARTLDTHIDERRVRQEEFEASGMDDLLEFSDAHLEWLTQGSYANGKFEPVAP